ncbi:unnamed protein product [Caenorhabditis brenneri]
MNFSISDLLELALLKEKYLGWDFQANKKRTEAPLRIRFATIKLIEKLEAAVEELNRIRRLIRKRKLDIIPIHPKKITKLDFELLKEYNRELMDAEEEEENLED